LDRKFTTILIMFLASYFLIVTLEIYISPLNDTNRALATTILINFILLKTKIQINFENTFVNLIKYSLPSRLCIRSK
jgi:hypothetical protein